MAEVLIRSRSGFWTAFRRNGEALLNLRGLDGSTATHPLTEDDCRVLLSGSDEAEALVDSIRRHGVPLAVAAETPPLTTGEPAPYEFVRRRAVEVRSERAA